MKFFRNITIAFVLIFAISSCKKDDKKDWNVNIPAATQTLEITDISKELYDPNLALSDFKSKYPWFQGTVSDADFEVSRKDPEEIKVYKDAISKIDLSKLKTELSTLFQHVQYYYPEYKIPKIYLYSSVMQGSTDPVFVQLENNFLFIDVTGFMGENSPHYKGLEQYFRNSMNPVNIVPKVAQVLAEQFVPYQPQHQKFLDQIVYQGKILTVKNAFIPDFPDYLKLNYTQKQYEWAVENEVNIWDYFVENDLLYSDDARLVDRFIVPGPFSKFYTEIDNESSPQIGIFVGWQICKKYFSEKPETQLQDFLKLDAQTLFNEAQYRPKFK